MAILKKCELCQKYFWDKTRNGGRKFCSNLCGHRASNIRKREREKTQDLFSQFFKSKIKKNETNTKNTKI